MEIKSEAVASAAFLSVSPETLLILCLALLAVVSYFIGNISPATLVGRMHGIDIRSQGSGNPGTTNVLRTLGKRAAACTLIIDIMKGFLPAFFSGFIVNAFFDIGQTGIDIFDLSAAVCGTFALIGHMWPVCFKFKGGKGVATGFGVLMALDWKVVLTALFFAAAGVLISKRMSVGSIAAAISFPIAVYIFITRLNISAQWEMIWSALLAVLVIWRHRSNIGRLIKGEEPSLSFLSGRKSGRQDK